MVKTSYPAACGLVFLALLSGCGSEPGSAATDGVGYCDDLIAAGALDGELSDDPDVASDQLSRSQFGFRTDLAWVTLLRDPSVDAERRVWPTPMHPDEVEFLESPLNQALEESIEIVLAYGASHPDTYAGYWVHRDPDPHLEVGMTDGPEPHQAELQELLGSVAVKVVSAPYTDIETRAAAAQLSSALDVRNTTSYTVSIAGQVRVSPGRYLVEIGITDAPGADVSEAVAKIPADVLDKVCVRRVQVPRG